MKKVTALYFSATLTTRSVTVEIARSIAEELNLPLEETDITVPRQRKNPVVFGAEDIVVFGTPVYIGRVPNLISPYFRTVRGNGAVGVPVVVYGNRAYDDALIEMKDIMVSDGFRCPAAAAFIGEHSFSRVLGAGRPDRKDLEKAASFGRKVAQLVTSHDGMHLPFADFQVPGHPFPYTFYKASDQKGNKVDIRKVKPVTDPDLCTQCGFCADICPMEAIDPRDCSQVQGICIKCGACIKRCPAGAKRFVDESYVSHMNVIVEKFKDIRFEPEVFYSLS